MRKSYSISILSEVICAAGLTFLMVRKGFDVIGCIALALDLIALVMNLVLWFRKEARDDG